MKISVLGEGAEFSVFCTIDFCPALAALVSPVPNIISLKKSFSHFSPHGPATCGRILERNWDESFKSFPQGVTKRCRLSLLTNGALIYVSKCRGRGSVAGSQPMSTAVHIT